VADGAWSASRCRPDVLWWGVPGAGTWYWTARFGQYWVGGVVYQLYAQNGYECGGLGAPVKPYGFISEFGGGGEGVWFEGGAIVYRYDTRRWHVYGGLYGQTAGRLADERVDVPEPSEMPTPPGDWSDLPNYVTPKAPKITKAMKDQQ
jgi:hypothetical protein